MVIGLNLLLIFLLEYGMSTVVMVMRIKAYDCKGITVKPPEGAFNRNLFTRFLWFKNRFLVTMCTAILQGRRASSGGDQLCFVPAIRHSGDSVPRRGRGEHSRAGGGRSSGGHEDRVA